MNSFIARTRFAITAMAILAAAAFLPAGASAQVDSSGPWTAWLGCWEVAAPTYPDAPTATDRETVCVVPAASGTGAEAISLLDGSIVEREMLDASGARRSVPRDGCSGWEAMQWSRDGKRVFQHSEFDCGSGLERRSTGILTILPGGDWLSVYSVAAGEQADVRIVRRRPSTPERAGVEIASLLEGRAFAVETARMAAAARPTVEQVVEAVQTVDAAAVEGWLIESGHGFQLDARQLVALADAGVPARVIDLMVALSYPNVFAVNRSAREGELRPDEGRAPPPRRPVPVGVMSPWGYPGYGWGTYPRYRGWYGPPVIVVRDGGSRNQGGSLVSGQGYTRGNQGNSGASGAGSSGGSQPSGNAAPAPRSGSGDSSSGTGRTATPRSGT